MPPLAPFRAHMRVRREARLELSDSFFTEFSEVRSIEKGRDSSFKPRPG
jgi:hypothetical protein